MNKVSSKTFDFSKIKVILCDWDGVFHSGYKNHLGESLYSEADSMGINMLRFGLWLESGKMPYSGIITGELNPTAQFLGRREHFHSIYCKAKDKSFILKELEQKGFNSSEVLFLFDDILDLSLAEKVGYRFFIPRENNHHFNNFVENNDYADFVTSNTSDHHAVREICEFILQKMGYLDKTFNERIEYSEVYKDYLAERNKITTEVITV